MVFMSTRPTGLTQSGRYVVNRGFITKSSVRPMISFIREVGFSPSTGDFLVQVRVIVFNI